MNKSNKAKAELLGMPFGTAGGRLRKLLLFDAIQRLGEDSCFRCGKPIELLAEFSIEHKKSWASSANPVEMFFSLENISFSHLACNIGAASKLNKVWISEAERSKVRSAGRRKDPVLYAKHLEEKRSAKRWRS